MFTSWITILIIIVPLNYELCFCQCANGEYEIDKRCCPMCPPGSCVFWPCTHDTNTTCGPCPEFTFIDEPNDYKQCFPCSVCNADQGLRLSKACTPSSDTVCEPLEGFYCIGKNKGSCTFAEPHTQCRPGQYIKQAGTGFTDTVCVDCTDHTYSTRSFSACLPHTKCEATGRVETNPGTPSSDTECGDSSMASLITLPIIAALIFIASASAIMWHLKKKNIRLFFNNSKNILKKMCECGSGTK